MIWLLFAALSLVVLGFFVGPLPRAERKRLLTGFLLLPTGALLLYLYLGAPDLPGRPFAARRDDPDFHLNAIAETLAEELRAHPDRKGYKNLAAMMLVLRRYDQAIESCRKAIALGTNDAEIWSRLGESLTRANDGLVPMEALTAFGKALQHDPQEVRARYSIGLAEAQIGHLQKAVGIWRAMEKDAPPGARWLPQVQKNIHEASKRGKFDPASIEPLEAVKIKLPGLK